MLRASIANHAGQLPDRMGTRSNVSALLPACVLRQLPGSEGARRIVFAVIASLCASAAAARVLGQSPSTTAATPNAINRLRRSREHRCGAGAAACLGAVWQVRLSVAPHVIEGTAALPKVKAG